MSGANIGLLEILTILSSKYDFIIVSPSYGKFIGRLLNLKPESTIIIKDYRWWMSSDVSKFNVLFILKQKIKNFIAIRDIYLLLRNRQFELIFSNTVVINIGAKLSQKLQKPHYWYFHEFGKLDHNLNFTFGEKISRKQIKKIGGTVIANSKITSDYYSKWLSQSIEFLYQPVIFDEVPKPIVKQLDKISFILFGRISINKGQLFALRAMRELNKSQNKAIKLTILGNCDDIEYLLNLEEYIKKHEMEQFVKIIPHEANPYKIVNQHDIVLNLSENEAFGRMNIEAMKLGKILVSNNKGSSSELIIHGYNGFIFEHNSLASFTRLISEIGLLSDNQIRNISQNAMNYANEMFNDSKTLEKLNEIINE